MIPAQAPAAATTSLSRFIKPVIVVGILLIALLIFLNQRNYGWIEVSVPKNLTASSASFTIQDNGEEDITVRLPAGEAKKVRVRAGMVRVNSASGSVQSVDIIRVEGFRTTKLSAPKGEQRAVTQLATYIHYCPLLVGEQVYSYDCQGTGPVVKHTKPQLGNTRNVPLFDEEGFENAKPVKDGLLALRDPEEDGEPQRMVYINLVNETLQAFDPVAYGLPSLAVAVPTIIVPSSPTSTHFALSYSADNKIYLFDNVDDQRPTLIEPKEAKMNQEGRVAQGSFWEDSFVLYLGKSGDLGEGEATENKKAAEAAAKLTNLVLEYDLDGKQTQTTYLPQDINAFAIFKFSQDYYASEDNEGFDIYYRKDNGLTQIYSMTGLADWELYEGKAYLQDNNTLFEFIPGKEGLFSLQSRYASSSVRVSRIASDEQGILFTGVPMENDPDSTSLYRLSKDRETGENGQASNSRLEPDYSDLRRLTDGGISYYQLVNLHYALDGFMTTLPALPKEVTVDNIQFPPYDRNAINDSTWFTFDFTFENNQKYLAKIEQSDMTNLTLWVYDTGSNQLYTATVNGMQYGVQQ